MPRHERRNLSPGWQSAFRDGKWYLQKQRPDGAWEDFSGPYKQHGGAREMWTRQLRRELSAARVAGVKHPWAALQKPCPTCGVRMGLHSDTDACPRERTDNELTTS